MSSQLSKDLIASNFIDPYDPAHQLGPDYVLPCDDIRTWSANGNVKIHEKPPFSSLSIVTFLHNTVKAIPNKTALVVKRNGQNVSWTYQQYWDEIRTVTKAFIKLGLVPFHGVCILGFNSPEWVISHFAAIFAGGFSAGIYTTNSPAACFLVLNDCDANIIVVENEMQLDKVLQIRDKLPQLKAIIQYSGASKHPDVISWRDLLLIGQSLQDDVLERRIKGLATNQCAFLIYTSGTTGPPKGTMISHDNAVTFASHCIKRSIEDRKRNFRIVSYLPLSHMAATGTDIYASIFMGGTVFFAPPDALKGKLLETLQEVQPTIFIAVPRMIEKMYEKIKEREKSMNWIQKILFSWAKKQALYYHRTQKFISVNQPLQYSLAINTILRKVKCALGLQHVKHFVCGGAPLSAEIKEYFISLDLLILEGYGLSECTGIHTTMFPNDNSLNSVGKIGVIKDYEVKILSPDKDGNGEILLRGRNICMGYLKLEKDTRDIIDNERWFHTGDIGRIDKDNYLCITGRFKELVITAGGENIPPLLIEETIKKNVPVISNCVLIGDERNYLTVLVTLKTVVDMDTLLPTDQLTEEAVSWCQSVGSEAKTVKEVLVKNDSKVICGIQAGITKYNDESAISNAQKVQKFTLLPQDFNIGSGELGQTMKLRRYVILKKYSELIDKMYRS